MKKFLILMTFGMGAMLASCTSKATTDTVEMPSEETVEVADTAAVDTTIVEVAEPTVAE